MPRGMKSASPTQNRVQLANGVRLADRVGIVSSVEVAAAVRLLAPEASIPGGGNSPSRCRRLLASRAIMLGAAVPPGLLVRLAGVGAWPELRFATGQPVVERVAAGAAATALLPGVHRLPSRPATDPSVPSVLE
jgi:hypothetical protein